ncbi:MAG: trypsin-like peptidase domain-containing protein [Bacillota bacterium]|nr:trypsin-like peptidase domain-containing protein [Bacillota bacterium]
MSEFFSGDVQGPRRRRRALLSYLFVGLIGAVIGGLLVVTVAPTYLLDRMPYLGYPPGGAPGQSGIGIPPGSSNGAATPAEPGSVTYAAERVGPAVVGIINKAIAYDVFRRPYTEERSGSGVVFHQDGYIVTNNHVVEGARELLVSLSDGRSVTAEIVGTDPFTDLAVIKAAATGLPMAEFGDSDALVVGELAVAIGNPVGLEFARTVTAGVISGLNRRVQQGERFFVLVQTDAAINPGNSGGPLVNGRGQVVGINTIKFAAQGIEGMGFAIPINLVRPVANELVSQGRIVRPWLGVRIAGREDAARFGVQVERGVLVVESIDGGPAARAGIRTGDVIISVAGREVNSTAELTEAVQAHRVGQAVQVVVLRRGTQLTYSVVLGEMQV